MLTQTLVCQRLHEVGLNVHGAWVMQEMKALEPHDRVLLMATSAEPHICVKKDEKAYIGFFDKHMYVPLPDYASRLVSAFEQNCLHAIIRAAGGLFRQLALPPSTNKYERQGGLRTRAALSLQKCMVCCSRVPCHQRKQVSSL